MDHTGCARSHLRWVHKSVMGYGKLQVHVRVGSCGHMYVCVCVYVGVCVQEGTGMSQVCEHRGAHIQVNTAMCAPPPQVSIPSWKPSRGSWRARGQAALPVSLTPSVSPFHCPPWDSPKNWTPK